MTNVLIDRDGIDDEKLANKRVVVQYRMIFGVLKKVLNVSHFIRKRLPFRVDHADELGRFTSRLSSVVKKLLSGCGKCVNSSQVAFEKPQENGALQLPGCCIYSGDPNKRARGFWGAHRSLRPEQILHHVGAALWIEVVLLKSGHTNVFSLV